MNDLNPTQRFRVERARKQQSRVRTHHPGGPWEVGVDVYLYSVDDDGNADFEVETCLPTEPNGAKHPRIDFYNDGHEKGFKLIFTLYDNTRNGQGSGYRFPLTDQNAIWSALGEICPTEDNPTWTVFPQTGINVQHPQVMTACNPNPAPAQGLFQYTLNVSLDGNPPYVHLDPGGNNMNGGSGFVRE